MSYKVGYVWKTVYLGADATTTNNSYRMIRSSHQCVLPIAAAELAALAHAVTRQMVELAWVDREPGYTDDEAAAARNARTSRLKSSARSTIGMWPTPG